MSDATTPGIRQQPLPAAMGWVRVTVGLLSGFLFVNGAWMLAAPTSWYDAVPGADATGALNHHFVRDIGIAYLTVAAALALAARRQSNPAPLIAVALVFLGGHGLLHLAETATVHGGLSHLAIDFPGVYLPALLLLGLLLYLRRGPSCR